MDMYRRYYPSSGESIVLAANFCQAADPIRVAIVRPRTQPTEGDWFSTPFQVADARHRPNEAFRLVRAWLAV